MDALGGTSPGGRLVRALPARVVVGHDHPLLLQSLADLVQAAGAVEVVARTDVGTACIEATRHLRPSMVLLGLQHASRRALTTLRLLHHDLPGVRVVAVGPVDAGLVLDTVDAGAIGYLREDGPLDQLVAGVELGARGGHPLHPDAAAALLLDRARRREDAELTPREVEVLRLVAAGLLNKQVARRLDISEKTVKAHLGRVYQRTGSSRRGQAVAWASDHGLLDGPAAGGPGPDPAPTPD